MFGFNTASSSTISMLCDGSWLRSIRAVLKASILPDDHRLRGASLGSAGICYGNGEQEKEREEMRIVSLLYHDVVPPGDFESSGFPGGDAAIYKLELPEFEQHLNAIHPVISRHVTLRELPHLQTPPMLLTFDDGGSSAHTYIAD